MLQRYVGNRRKGEEIRGARKDPHAIANRLRPTVDTQPRLGSQLGCGGGYAGILAFLDGADHVAWQDYVRDRATHAFNVKQRG